MSREPKESDEKKESRKSKESKESRETKENTYVILQETNGEESESWYYFLKWEGNEDNLNFMNEQLESVDWRVNPEYSVFEFDLEHRVSEITAKEMTNVDINHFSFHRKFDGTLRKIDFRLKDKMKNKKKMKKIFDKIGKGKIDRYIDGEDVDSPQKSSSGDDDDDDDDDDDEDDEDDDEDDDEENVVASSDDDKSN